MATKEKTEEKKVQITPEVDESFEKIKKNIAYCEENKCPEALKKGGKFYEAFKKLVLGTVDGIEIVQLSATIDKMLPIPGPNKERFDDIKSGIMKARRMELITATMKGSMDELRLAYLNIINDYIGEYTKVYSLKY